MEGPLDKIPPQSLEAEQAVLGAMLLERDALARAITLLEPGDFYRDTHRMLYEGMVELFNREVPVDLVTLGEYLRDHQQLERAGGIPYLTDLHEACPTAANVEQYARRVRAKAVQRRLMVAACEITAQAAEPGVSDVHGLLTYAQQLIQDLAGDSSEAAPIGVRDLLAQTATEIDARREQGRSLQGLSVGLTALDRKMGGLQPRRLYVIGSRPGVGKSSLALNWANRIGVDEGLPVAYFSLEMAREELGIKLVALRTGIATERLANGMVSASTMDAVRACEETVGAGGLEIFDSTGMTLDQIGAHCRVMQSRVGLAAVFVDYLQLVRCPSFDASDVRMRVTAVAQGLKSLARRLQVPVVALSALRRLGGGENALPCLSDLKESGDIEAEADVAAMLYRDEQRPGTLAIIVAKNRHGERGTVYAQWEGETQAVLPYGEAAEAQIALERAVEDAEREERRQRRGRRP